MSTADELMKLDMVDVCALGENYLATEWVNAYHRGLLKEIVESLGQLSAGGKICVSDKLESTKRNYFISHFCDWNPTVVGLPFMPTRLLNYFHSKGQIVKYYSKVKNNQTFYRILIC